MEPLNVSAVAQKALDAIREKISGLQTLNIIVCGKTGVGKSTLINAVFRDKPATTGIGQPVTKHMRQIGKKGVPLCIYDTPGFELGQDVQNQVKREILDTIRKGYRSKDLNQTIHCIWYCINTASNRVEPKEIQWLRELAKENRESKVPIIVVLTQSISKANASEMQAELKKANLNVASIVPVLAVDYPIDEDRPPILSYGLDELIQIMANVLPDDLIDTLQNLQIVSLEEKNAAHMRRS